MNVYDCSCLVSVFVNIMFFFRDRDLPFLSLTPFEGCSEFCRISHLLYLRLKKLVHLSAKEILTQIRNSVWELRLPHVLQRFVGTNILTEVILFNNLRT